MIQFNSTIWWQTGDKALVPYFGNDESRYGSLVEVTVLAVNSDVMRRGETGLVTVRMMDSVNNEDEYGNSRDYMDAVRWSTQLTEVL